MKKLFLLLSTVSFITSLPVKASEELHPSPSSSSAAADASAAFVGHSRDPIDADLSAGWAKILVWDTCLPERAGHVALKTDRSYISIWPDREVSKEAPFAPAVSIKSYKHDLRRENHAKPNSVYLIRLNSEKINRGWEKILKSYSEELSHDSRSLKCATWFAPSGSALPGRADDKIHVNCASAVLLAMYVGGIDVQRLISGSQFGNQLLQSAQSLYEQFGEEIQGPAALMAALGVYESIIKPNDIGTFVQGYIRNQAKAMLRSMVSQGQIVFITGEGVDHMLDRDDILWAIDKNFDESRFKREFADGEGSIDEFLALSGDLQEVQHGSRKVKYLRLNDKAIKAITSKKAVKVKLSVTTLGGILGGLGVAAATESDVSVTAIIGGAAAGATLGYLAADCIQQ